jgi:hypothetical protein
MVLWLFKQRYIFGFAFPNQNYVTLLREYYKIMKKDEKEAKTTRRWMREDGLNREGQGGGNEREEVKEENEK